MRPQRPQRSAGTGKNPVKLVTIFSIPEAMDVFQKQEMVKSWKVVKSKSKALIEASIAESCPYTTEQAAPWGHPSVMMKLKKKRRKTTLKVSKVYTRPEEDVDLTP